MDAFERVFRIVVSLRVDAWLFGAPPAILCLGAERLPSRIGAEARGPMSALMSSCPSRSPRDFDDGFAQLGPPAGPQGSSDRR